MEYQNVWDSLEEPYAIFGLLFLLSNKLETAGSAFLDGLTTKQWAFLAVLETFFSEPPTISALAKALGTSHQNIKQTALRMEKKGFVRLKKDPRDSRATLVHLTPLAAEYDKAHEERNEKFLRSMFRGLDAEKLKTMKLGLLQLSATLDTMKEETL